MADIRTPKRLRHLEHLLAQPGTVTPRGLLLVTLEQTGSKIEVVCPSFGIPMASIFGDVPIAFMWHDKRDESWEPIVLYNGTKDAVRFFGERTPELETLPPQMRTALQQWIRDWRSSSLGCGRPAPPPHVWTPDRNTTDLPRLTQLRGRFEGATATTLVRDRSNRLAGVLFTVGPNQLFVPCLDDGSLAEPMPRVFEADSIPPAPLDAYLKFYATLVNQWNGLTPTALLAKMDDSAQIVGFVTAVGSMVPTAPGPLGQQSDLPVQQMDAFPWERDSLILRPADAVSLVGSVLEESTASVEEQLAEAYQYLRLSLSNWLIRDARGPAMRASLAKLLASSLPLYEKRKRMDIVLEPLVREWTAVEITTERKSLSLLRQDCLSLEGPVCSETEGCRLSSSPGEEGNRCLIHAPTREAGTDPIRIFTARLSDELLRYSSARNEILGGKVQAIRTPRGAVRIGDELFMATKPKESAHAILDRLGFTGKVAMSFPEEMLRFDGLEEEADVPVLTSAVGLPETWTSKGFRIPNPPEETTDARGLAFVEGTGKSMKTWVEFVNDRRTKLGLHEQPFQWSQQDLYVLASLTMSNILFVNQAADGALTITKWIAPPYSSALSSPQYMIFWGARELLVTKGGKIFRYPIADLPGDLLTAMDGASPVPEEEVKAVIQEAPAVPTVVPTVVQEVPAIVQETPSVVQETPAVQEAPIMFQETKEAMLAKMKADLVTLNKTGDMDENSDTEARKVLRTLKWTLPENLQQRYNAILSDIDSLEGDSLNNAVDELKELVDEYSIVQETKPVVPEETQVVQQQNPAVQTNAEKVLAPIVNSVVSTVAAASEQVADAAQNLTKIATTPPGPV